MTLPDNVLKALKGGEWMTTTEVCERLGMCARNDRIHVVKALNKLFSSWLLIERVPVGIPKGGTYVKWRKK